MGGPRGLIGGLACAWAVMAATPSLAQTGLSRTYMVVSDRGTGRIVRFDPDTGGRVDDFSEGDPQVGQAEDVVFGPDQNLYTAMGRLNRVHRYNGSTAEFMDRLAEGAVIWASGLAFGPDGDLYVSSFQEDEVVRFDGVTGAWIENFVPDGYGGLDGPVDLLFHTDGRLYVASQRNHRILRYDATTGEFLGQFVGPGSGTCPAGDPVAGAGDLCGPYAMAFGPDGAFYVSSVVNVPSTHNARLLRYDGQSGAYLGTVASGFAWMAGFAFRGGSVFVCGSFDDMTPGAVHRFDLATGAYLGVFASEELQGPHGLLFYTWESELDSTAGQSSVASSPTGTRVVVWTDQDSDGRGVFAQRFDASGRASGGVIQVNTTTAGNQHSPAVAWAGPQRFAVVWLSGGGAGKQGGNGVFGRLFNGSGGAVTTEFQVSAVNTGVVISPEVAGNESLMAAVWTASSTGKVLQGGDGVFGRLFGSDGSPQTPVFPIDPDPLAGSPAVTLLGARPYVVWSREVSKVAKVGATQGGEGIFGRTFGLDGSPIGDVVVLDGGSRGQATTPAIDTLGGTTAVAVWARESSTGRGDIFGRQLSTSGAPLGSEFRVNLDQDRSESAPKVAGVEGGFSVTWNSTTTSGGSGVFGRLFSPDGSPGRTDILIVDQDSSEAFVSPDVGLDEVGNFTVVFDRRVVGQQSGVLARTTVVELGEPVDPSPCDPGATALCVNNARFRVEVAWRDPQGRSGSGQAVHLTGDTGYFWFFDDANVELVVKVLDGTWLNGHYWVFYGALSDVEYAITVTDTATGAVRRYTNPQGTWPALPTPPPSGGGKGGLEALLPPRPTPAAPPSAREGRRPPDRRRCGQWSWPSTPAARRRHGCA